MCASSINISILHFLLSTQTESLTIEILGKQGHFFCTATGSTAEQAVSKTNTEIRARKGH